MAKKPATGGIVSADFSARLGKLTGAATKVEAPALAPDLMEQALGAGVDLGPMGLLRWVPVEELDDSPFQTRGEMSDAHLQGLTESLDGQGLIEIPPARFGPNGRVQIGAGHCRTEAVRLGANAGSNLPQPERFAGKMLFLVKERSDLEMAAIGVDENAVRENPNPIELAQGYRNLATVLRREGLEGAIAADVIAERAGVSKRRIYQLMALLELPEPARKKIASGEWNEKHGRALREVAPENQALLMGQIEKQELSGNAAIRRAGELVKTHPTAKNREMAEIADAANKHEADKRAQKPAKSSASLKSVEKDSEAKTETDTKATTTPAQAVAGASARENHLRAALNSLSDAVVSLQLAGGDGTENWSGVVLGLCDQISDAADAAE